jgi:carboxyl-terminal processing protease
MILKRGGLFLGLTVGAILSVVFISGFLFGDAYDRHESSSSLDASNPDIQSFLSAYHLVTQNSYYRPFDKHRLLYAAIDGMLSATGDPHTVFLSPPENQQANTQLNGNVFSGIGAIVAPAPGGLEIVSPVNASPAARAGLRSGDIVMKINGNLVTHMSSATAIARIHGRQGTTVRLTIRRQHASLFTVTVRRAMIPPITAYGRMLAHRIGYVQIFSFGGGTAQEVAGALRTLVRGKVRGLVLDLRGNPGGFVDAAQSIVSEFVSGGVIAYEKQADKSLAPLTVLGGKQIVRGIPIAVLVDADSASAAEITAAALRDDDHAVLVGTRTYGKGSMQSIYQLADGSTIRLTDRLWLTPQKLSIANVGLQPDILVAARQKTGSNDPDLQLTAAVHYLRTHLQR